jgi:hypothetical protein
MNSKAMITDGKAMNDHDVVVNGHEQQVDDYEPQVDDHEHDHDDHEVAVYDYEPQVDDYEYSREEEILADARPGANTLPNQACPWTDSDSIVPPNIQVQLDDGNQCACPSCREFVFAWNKTIPRDKTIKGGLWNSWI